MEKSVGLTACFAEILNQLGLSRSQRRVLRNFNNFLSGKGKFKDTEHASAASAGCEDQLIGSSELAKCQRLIKPQGSEDAEIVDHKTVKFWGTKRKFKDVGEDNVKNNDEDDGRQVGQEGKSVKKEANLNVRTKFDNSKGNNIASNRDGGQPIRAAKLLKIEKKVKVKNSKDLAFVDNTNDANRSKQLSARRRRWQAKQDRMLKRAKETGVPYEAIMK
ncbi:unnamed protein product, partial [Hydatigera taeniaeformis]|uniref:SURF6 domain-containing protein n=1 Tax=Hydatigena taeniaeformis TaxID=6205 RepID=A0A0R3WV69_HYDTA